MESCVNSCLLGPWTIALEMLRQVDMEAERVHRYGNILGLPALRQKISIRLEKLGFDTSDMEIVITNCRYICLKVSSFVRSQNLDVYVQERIKHFRAQL